MEKRKVEMVLDRKIMYAIQKLNHYLMLRENEGKNGNQYTIELLEKQTYAERRVIGAYLNVAESLGIISSDEWNHCVDTIYGDNMQECHYEGEVCIIRK